VSALNPFRSLWVAGAGRVGQVSTVAPAGSWSGSIRRPRSVAASNSRSSRRERPGWPPKQAAPIVPVIVSGTQRIWTKGHPRNLGLNKVPVTVAVGAPFPAAQDVAQTDAALRESMTTLLDEVQQRYHHPAGAYWVPRRLGGGAPTLAEAVRIDVAEAAAKAAGRTPHQ